MVLKISFSKNNVLVPFDYQSKLNGYLHKILGENNPYHDGISIHSVSNLFGGKFIKSANKLDFKNGAYWYVASPSEEFISSFVKNVFNDMNTVFAYGMSVENVCEVVSINRSGDEHRLRCVSPILLKQDNKHFTYKDNETQTSEMMKNLILKKAEILKFNLSADDFSIKFDKSYDGKKTKLIKFNNVNNRSSACPVIVKTDNNDIVEFIKNVGVGHSTGCGFGFVQ